MLYGIQIQTAYCVPISQSLSQNGALRICMIRTVDHGNGVGLSSGRSRLESCPVPVFLRCICSFASFCYRLCS